MSTELLLARRLIEALVDPDSSRDEADAAASEFAEIAARFEIPLGRPLPVDTFDGLVAADLSPAAWLYLLENRPKGEPEIPIDILDALFRENADAAVRSRIVTGALAQPQVRARYGEVIGGLASAALAAFPDSFPQRWLKALALTATDGSPADRDQAPALLTEFILYLLQDGTPAALALAAAAIDPSDLWRGLARQTVDLTLQRVDPASDFVRAFDRARFDRHS